MKPDFWLIARLEAGFFRRSPKLLLAAVVVTLIPALYVLIYLSSVWDPASHTGALPVAIVNLDQGLEYRQQVFNVGRDVTDRLKAKPSFGYVDLASEQLARSQVRQGLLAFALIIPADFSSNAVPGAQAGAGKLVIYTSEGNSYSSAGLARRFAEDLGREVNQSLNEQRWALVLSDADGSQRSIERLHDGVIQLRLGAKELNSGAQQVAKAADVVSGGANRVDQSVGQLTAGVKELSGGIKTLYAQRPRNSALNRLEEGSRSLASGHEEMGRALGQLHQGALSLQTGVNSFSQEANDSLFVTNSVLQGLGQLGDGLGGLETGLKSASFSHAKLAEGANQLNTAVGTLTTGLRGLNNGLRTMVAQLPDDAKLDELNRGADSLSNGSAGLKMATQKLNLGTQHLAGGLDLLEMTLPAQLKKMDGNAQGLANSVQPSMEVAAAVQNNGSAFAPNIIPGALWLGASLAAFLIHLRRLPHQAQGFSAFARMLGKVVLPLAVVLLQALLVGFSVLYILQLSALDGYALMLTLMLASGAFLLIVFALTRAFGDAGKALALLLLAVQLSSSGGVLPVELSGGLFAQISPYLPITWVVKAIKASLFGAFEGFWQTSLQWVALTGVLAATSACFVGRWRFVKASSLRPTLDL
jgi:putative membrane protein